MRHWTSAYVCLLLSAAPMTVGCGSRQSSDKTTDNPPPADTRTMKITSNGITVAGGKITLKLPNGWVVSPGQTDAVVAESNHNSAVIACLTMAPTTDASALSPQLDTLLQAAGVSVSARAGQAAWQPSWARADEKRQSGPLEVSLFQTDQARRRERRGFALVFTTATGGTQLLALGFAAQSDNQAVDEILHVIDGLGTQPQ
ncbi:MAG: hypothetical protein U0271_11055 [Polyangiaceae bacterium]